MRKSQKLKRTSVTLAGQGSTPHDRRSTDLLRNAQVVAIEVDDPGELVMIGSTYQRAAPDGKIVAFRSLRDDPLGRMEDRSYVDSAQVAAGRLWQTYWETIEVCGSKAIDFTKEAVDGGGFRDPFDAKHSKAVKELGRAAKAVGMLGEQALKDVLANRMFLNQVAVARNITPEEASARFRRALEAIAILWGFAMRSPSYPQDVVRGA